MRFLFPIIAAAAVVACGGDSSDTAASGFDTGVQQSEVGANSYTEDQARNRLISLGYAAPTMMTMTETGAWRAVTRDPAGTAVTVLVDYRGKVTIDPATAGGAAGMGSSGMSGSGGAGGTGTGTGAPGSSPGAGSAGGATGGSSGGAMGGSTGGASGGTTAPPPSGGASQRPG